MSIEVYKERLESACRKLEVYEEIAHYAFDRLTEIANMETPTANSTVKKMAAKARCAAKEVNDRM